MFGSFLPSLGCLAAIKSTQVEGADIVMKSSGGANAVAVCWPTSRYGTTAQCYEFAHALYREVFYRRQASGRLGSCSCASRNALERLFSEHKNEVTSDNEPPRESWPGKFVVRTQWCYHLSSGWLICCPASCRYELGHTYRDCGSQR